MPAISQSVISEQWLIEPKDAPNYQSIPQRGNGTDTKAQLAWEMLEVEANKRDIEEVTPTVPVSVPLRLELKQRSKFAVLGDNPGQNEN